MWFNSVSIEDLNLKYNTNMGQYLGIEYLEIGENYLTARMPVDQRTTQPFGLLHGGASVVLAESLGSLGSNLMVDQTIQACVGLEVNANHLRGVDQGYVIGKAEILHKGKKTHVWDIKIRDQQGNLVCISRLTVAIIDKKR